jgi:hypothetical protein
MIALSPTGIWWLHLLIHLTQNGTARSLQYSVLGIPAQAVPPVASELPIPMIALPPTGIW